MREAGQDAHPNLSRLSVATKSRRSDSMFLFCRIMSVKTMPLHTHRSHSHNQKHKTVSSVSLYSRYCNCQLFSYGLQHFSVPWLSTIYCHEPSFLSNVSWIIDATFLKLFPPFVFFCDIDCNATPIIWVQITCLWSELSVWFWVQIVQIKISWFEESEESKVCECDCGFCCEEKKQKTIAKNILQNVSNQFCTHVHLSLPFVSLLFL